MSPTTYTLKDITVFSLQDENFQKKSKNLVNLEAFSSELCIIYNNDNANPYRYVYDAFRESPTELILFVGNQKIINEHLIVGGVQAINDYGAKFVYSDGFLANKFIQPIYLPPYKPNLVKENQLILNMPILVVKDIDIREHMQSFLTEKINILSLFFLFYILTTHYIGYHLAKPTYHTYNFTEDVSKEVKLLGIK